MNYNERRPLRKIFCHFCNSDKPLPQQVQWNINSSMHCYETRFGGKCATEVTLPSVNQKISHFEETRNCQSQQPACCEQPLGGTGHHLRSRSHFWPQGGLVATTAEEQTRDSNSQPQPARTTRDVEDTSTQLASNVPLRSRKRLSAEEKLIQDNKAYYKLEMKNNKLRSSGYFMTNRSSFEMGHAFAREAEASTVIAPKSSPVYVNYGGGIKNNNDIKTISHKISNDFAVKDSHGEDFEKSRLRSSRKSDLECCNGPESIVCEKSINNSGVNVDQCKNSSSDTKNNNQHKSVSECKAQNRRTGDCAKDPLSSNPQECNETVEKSTSSSKQVCEESRNQLDAKTESSGSGINRTRIRLSELSLLSNEAENFMFGEPVKKMSSDESSDEDCVPLKLKIVKKYRSEDQKTKWKTKQTVGLKKRKRRIKKVQRKEKVSSGKTNKKIPRKCRKKTLHGVQQYDDSSVESTDAYSLGSSSDTNISRRHRKRRTHAEAFIHDNLDYYKFEIPGSRLRFQGSVLPQVVPNENQTPETEIDCSKKLKENNLPSDSNKENSSSSSDTPLIQFSVKSLEAMKKGLNEKLAVETDSLPLHEPESVVEPGIKKEDLNDKNNSNNSLTKEITLDRLRFSFEAAPQREPWYQTYQRHDSGNEIYLSCPIDTSYWKSFLLPYEMTPAELASIAVNSSLPSCSRSLDESMSLRKKRKRFAHLLDKKPRKSPRCHASTLAILSGLVHFRKRKEPDKSKEDPCTVKLDVTTYEEDEEQERNKEDSSCLPILEELSTIEETPEMKREFSDLAMNIDEMLEAFPENESCIPLSPKTSSSVSEPKLRTCRSNRITSKKNKWQKEKVSKKLPPTSFKESDLIDVDSFMLGNLIMSKDKPESIPKQDPHNRGGPIIDVVSLLDSYSECCCANVMVGNKDCLRCGKDLLSPALREVSCNSSECGASSTTCDTIVYSDAFGGRRGIRGKRRKRKKNRTGWPVDKQKFKKRFHLRFKKDNENAPISKNDPVKRSAPEKSGGSVNVSITGGSSSVTVDTGVQACKEKVENTEHSENVERKDVKVAPIGTKVVSKDEEVCGVGMSSELNRSDRKIDNSLENVPVSCNLRTEKHSRLLRTGSLDSSTRSELKPCVKVKRIPDITEYQILPSFKIGISSRRLRSASSSSLSSTPVTKSDFADDSMKDESAVNRRSCRKKRPKFSESWDGWWSPSHR